eukprot:TRINITY_DN192_c2_g1_i2.p1 TRINITY_DN192_c2_g1~~TRINITY_DN192_c2_g1_i2.p1  ORF type:complete len:230 (+),score=37.64 TRINITY_DN192_c2_g1_i2:52-690(+)
MGNCSSDNQKSSRAAIKSLGRRSFPKKSSSLSTQSGGINTHFKPNTAPKVEEHLYAMCMRMGPMNEVETYCNDGKKSFEAALNSKPGSFECRAHLDSAMVSLKKARDVEERVGEATLNLGITYLHLGHIHMFFNEKKQANICYQNGKEVMANIGRTLDGYQLLRTFSKERMQKRVSISSSEPELIGRISPRTPSSSSPHLLTPRAHSRCGSF